MMLFQALLSCATASSVSSSMLRGIDVSHYQGTIDWHKVSKVPLMTFACAKATEGLTYTDAQFHANWVGMKAAGLVRCAYHFARLNENATAQAGFFVKTVNAAGGYKTGPTLQLMLDLESSPSSAGLSPAHIWSWVQEFLGSIKRLTGRPGIIYTGYSFWDVNVGGPSSNLDAPLWIASYTHPAPHSIPTAWPSGYTFWQYDDNGASAPGGSAASIPGIGGAVDVDVFKYDKATLLKFCFSSASSLETEEKEKEKEKVVVKAPSCPHGCPGPQPGMPNYKCPDGSIGGPVCGPPSCTWRIRSCPTTPNCTALASPCGKFAPNAPLCCPQATCRVNYCPSGTPPPPGSVCGPSITPAECTVCSPPPPPPTPSGCKTRGQSCSTAQNNCCTSSGGCPTYNQCKKFGSAKATCQPLPPPAAASHVV